MTNTACHPLSPCKTGTPDRLIPGEHLFIYYFKGRADMRRTDLGPWFIGNWEEEDCSFLFFSEPAEQAMNLLLERHPTLSLIDTFEMPYSEWQPMDGFPLEAGGFYIYPPWASPAEAAGMNSLILDPGLVFGSGFHATTNDCLEALDLMCYNNFSKIRTAVDIGTGSGLLAIAAASRGVSKVIALDNNLLAAETARHNVGLNNLEDQVLVIKGSALVPAYRQTDLLMANIHYEVMDAIIDSQLFLNSRWFILSGLLRTPAKKIISRLNNLSTEIIKVWNSDEIWYTVLGKQGGLNQPV